MIHPQTATGGAVNPEDVVRAELSAWSRRDVDEVMSHFSIDAVWENVPLGVVTGHRAIRDLAERYLRHITEFDSEILNLATAGNVVLTERVDRFVFDGEEVDARCMGAFEVTGDKITAWRDYFDNHYHNQETIHA